MTGPAFQREAGTRECPVCLKGRIQDSGTCDRCGVGVATAPPVFSDEGQQPFLRDVEDGYLQTKANRS